ncbi:MAG: glutamate-1-semialdehyde 2,1-aminomutase [Candidatus Omnitrophota bacterium]
MAKRITHNLFKKARKYLVGGVDSPVRAFGSVGGEPVLLKSGKGSQVVDYDGNKYIDYVLSWGALILGHAFSQVVAEVRKAASLGFSFGTTNKQEVELAGFIHDAIPVCEKIRFVNSGTEAVMGAIRLARGYTGRNKILKFEHSYHGHADYLLAKAGSGMATLGISASEGVPDSFVRNTLVVPWEDEQLLKAAFRKHGKDIAAVIFEPVGGNYGVIYPNLDFIRYLRKITQENGALLIADEVITGFRFNFGSFVYEYGIKPDLICLGKIIGGGLPVGAFGGRERIMNHLAPLGEVYQASTFSGNPIVMRSGLATLKSLEKRKADYGCLNDFTSGLVQNLQAEALKQDVDLQVSYFGSMFSISFKNKVDFPRFYKKLLSHGVYFAPSQFEANFVSFAHTQGDLRKTVSAITQSLAYLKER